MRRPLWIFLILVAGLLGGSAAFLQSRTFAGMVRGFLSRTLPRELGVSAEFTDFQLRLFPPGVSARNPELRLEAGNILGLQPDSVVKAGEVDVRFRPFQMLSGRIRIEQVRLVDADLALHLAPGSRASPAGLRWSQLFRVRLQSLALERSRLSVRWPDAKLGLRAFVDEARVFRLDDGDDYLLGIDARSKDLQLDHGRDKHFLSSLGLAARVGPAGIRVGSLRATRGEGDREARVRASGDIAGDLLKPVSLRAELDLEAEGEARGLLEDWVSASKRHRRDGVPPVAGAFSAKGRFSADLLHFLDTVAFDGGAQLRDGALRGWPVLGAEASLRVRAGVGSGADIELRSAKISGPGGGVVSAGATRFSVGASGPEGDIQVPVRIENAPLRWLTGPYASSVDNLDVSISGELDVDLRVARGFSLRSRADLRLGPLGVSSSSDPRGAARTRVLLASPSRLRGTFTVDERKLSPGQLEWKFGGSSFDIGGDVDWSGDDVRWNLRANGPVDLSDLKELGGGPIRGKGRLATTVHGPADSLAVDFDTELADATYLNMDFGSLQGRISLVDDQNVLRFDAVRGRNGETPYVVSGPIDFRGEGSLGLDVTFPGGRVEDFLAIFRPLTRDLSWFPQSLRGRLEAKGRVHGGLGLAQLIVDTRISGSDWTFFGERFRSVRFSGGYASGGYTMRDLEARKRSGAITGGISFDSKGRFDWKFLSRDFTLRDLDAMLRLAIPIRGDLQISSEGSGTLQSLESSTRVSLSRTVIRSLSFPPSSLEVKSRQGAWSATGNGFGDQLRLDWSQDPGSSGQSRIHLAAKSADFSPLLLLLNPSSSQDATLAGRLTGAVDLTYPGTAIERASGRLELTDFLAQKEGVSLKLAEPVSGRMVQGALTMPDIRIRGDSGATSRLSLASSEGRLRGSLRGDADLSAIAFLSPLFQQASGKVLLDMELLGSFESPSLAGRVEVRDGYLRTSALDSPLENLQGRVTIRSGRAALSGVHADLAQGRVAASGEVEFFTNRLPVADLSIHLDENRLKIYPFQFIKLRSARLRVSGDGFPYEISGAVLVEQGLSREKISGAGQGLALQSSLYSPPPTGDLALDFPKFRLNIDVGAESGLRVQNELLDAEMRGNVKVVNTVEAPRLMGKVELVPGQGRLSFKDHVFQIQSAQVKFENPAVLAPNFDLVATSEIGSTKVQLYTSGTADRFKVELSSNPVLPESEILSLLAMGRTLEESQRLRAGSTSGLQQSEAASLILQSLDFNRDVREKTGIQVGVGEAVDTSTGTSIFRPQSDLGSSVAPKIVLKRRIGSRVDLSVGSTVGAGASNQREVNADLYISPVVSLRGVWNFFEGSTSQETSTTTLQQSRTSYGLDLKLEKRFK